jgi:hypothetical protein
MTTESGFEPGSFVVCVDDRHPDALGIKSPTPNGWNPNASMDGLTKGQVYTVRSVVPAWGVRLVEIVRSRIVDADIVHFGGEAPFAFQRFRPLRKLSVDAFLKTETKVGEDA